MSARTSLPAVPKAIARSLFLALVALFFGLGALRLPIGTLSHAGPGLFPLLVSGLVLLIAALMLAGALADRRRAAGEPFRVNPRNIGIILLALAAFVVVGHVADGALAVVALVLVAGLAAARRDWKRSVLVAAGLVAVAYAFERLLGLNLQLF